MADIFVRQVVNATRPRVGGGDDVVRPSEAAFMPVTWTLITLSFCFLPIRFYTRWLAFHRLYWDDLLTLLAWFLSLALGIIATVSQDELYFVTYLSRNLIAPTAMPANPGDVARKAIRSALVSFVLLYTCLWLIKFGFLIFFWRLGAESIRNVRWYWRGVAGFTALAYVLCFPALPYHCAFGNEPAREGRFCGDRDRRLFEISTKVNCGLDVATDVMIMTIPLGILWRSMLAFRQKLALAGVFGLVIVTITVAIVRVGLTTISGKAMNLPWVVVWTGVEANIAIIVACVGSFRMLYVQHREKQRSERNTYQMSRRAVIPRANVTLGSRGEGRFDHLGSEEALERRIDKDTDKSIGVRVY